MNSSKVSICYYPTTIAFIDDEQNFLDDLKLGLNEQLICKFYSHPEEFLDFLAHYHPSPFTDRCTTLNTEEIDYAVQEINLRTIRDEAKNKSRFHQLSTLITDYAMPGMNGLQCCEAIKIILNKVLLTGQADNDVAVKAFNKSLINKFIQKSAPDIMELLDQAIQEMQMKYFIDLSEKLYGSLPEKTAACLNDSTFANMFYTLCQEKNIIEYYLADEQGSFLMLDVNGKPSWLAVASDAQMNSYWEIASSYKETPKNILEAIQQRKMLPYFYSDKDLETAPQDWGKYLHPTQKLVTATATYYYTYIENNMSYQVEKVYSFADFIKKTRS